MTPQIAIASACTQEYGVLARETWDKNKEPYAKRWGYKATPLILPSGVDVAYLRFEKALEALESLPEGGWLCFTGCDAIITRPDVPLTYFIRPDCDFLCGIDRTVIFSDAWLMRNCEATRIMMRAVISGPVRGINGITEQDALTQYCFQGNFQTFAKLLGDSRDHGSDEHYETAQYHLNHSPVRVRILTHKDKWCGDPPWKSRPTMIPWFHEWHDAYFIAHFGGKSLQERLEEIPRYMKEIK
jgi:hypothetical protein